MNYFYLLLNIVGDIKDEAIVRIVWPSQFQLVELDRDQVCFHLMITKVILLMFIIFLMLLMIMLVMFMIAMSHMIARLMMVLVIFIGE